MVYLFYTTYISVDLAHRETFRAKVGKGGIKPLALVCGVFCEFVTFPLVSWVRCGT